jgi:hypothetical protein
MGIEALTMLAVTGAKVVIAVDPCALLATMSS